MDKKIADIPTIDKYIKKSDDFTLLRDYTLTEDLLEYYIKNTNNIDWYGISSHQIISENFILKYKHNLKWQSVSIKQKITEQYLDSVKERVNWISLIMNNDYDIFIIEKYIYYFNLYELSKNCDKPIVNKLISKYEHKYNIDKLSHEINNI